VNEYGPTVGVKELRQAVAVSITCRNRTVQADESQSMYNEDYRVGKESQYTYENVCIVPGGRAGMARLSAVIASHLRVFFTESAYVKAGRRLLR